MSSYGLAIPTKYNGVQFRSRLEARWAAFFDQLHWKWEYEPYDFNGWFPDFVLRGDYQETLVEVKPVRDFPVDVSGEIERSGCLHECLIVGVAPVFTQGYWPGESYTQLGWLAERYPEFTWVGDGSRPDFLPCSVNDEPGWVLGHPSYWWEKAVMGIWLGNEGGPKNTQQLFGFCHEQGAFVDRITGGYDGGHHGGDGDALLGGEIETHWKNACNAVQWNAPNQGQKRSGSPFVAR